MKIKAVKLKNFRSYRGEVEIPFADMNVFVGKNDVGKSTILEAIDIFINDKEAVVRVDPDDLNKEAENNDEETFEISIIFSDFPESLDIDGGNETTLEEEYLLNEDNLLEIKKVYKKGKLLNTCIIANHPSDALARDLLLKKRAELQRIVDENNIVCENRNLNAVLRKSIRDSIGELTLNRREIPVDKEDAKAIWSKLQQCLPVYALFQSDRSNSDQDSEVQDPMKLAVREILQNPDLQEKFREIAEEVEQKTKEIAGETLAKLREMNPEVAEQLQPDLPDFAKLKWENVFKEIKISSDNNIPLNKRGSGVKRLVLLNFFRAEAERRASTGVVSNIIYAIEEPETSQHQQHQRMLIEALKELAQTEHAQIVLTTHSPSIVKMLDFDDLKLVKKENSVIKVIDVEKDKLPYPSLNEVNYLAFGEADTEYHNELFGFIESEQKLNEYKSGKTTMQYIKMRNDGIPDQPIQIILSEYIRHQIHHPENNLNQRYTNEQLQESIRLMREFIQNNFN